MASADVHVLVESLRTDADAAANALDAGFSDETQEAVARIQAGLSEVERLVDAPAGPSGPVQDAEAANLEAEEQVLATLMAVGDPAVRIIRPMLGDHGDAFAGRGHAVIYQAILAADANGGADKITVGDYLERSGELDRVGGRPRMAELAKFGAEISTLRQYGVIVRRLHLERVLARATLMRPRNPEAIAEAAAALTREQLLGDPRRAIDAADWLANQPEGCPAVWGIGDTVLWAQGEPMMLYGPDGVGKTSVAQQLVLHLCGLRTDRLLGFPVARADRPVLYLAADRPRQARRSLYRMVPKEMREQLKGRLFIWEGPLPFSIPTNPRALLDFCELHGAGYLIIDSLKDVAVDLVKPEVALRVNQAFQWLAANEVELLALHHPRKDPAGAVTRPKTLEDVYGDRNFVGGMGSVVLLWGKAGDPIVELHHLKQPAGEVGPLRLIHDHDEGASELYESKSLIEILKASAVPLGVTTIAAEFYGVTEPDKNAIEKTRRQLRKLVADGMAQEMRDTLTSSLEFAAT